MVDEVVHCSICGGEMQSVRSVNQNIGSSFNKPPCFIMPCGSRYSGKAFTFDFQRQREELKPDDGFFMCFICTACFEKFIESGEAKLKEPKVCGQCAKTFVDPYGAEGAVLNKDGTALLDLESKFAGRSGKFRLSEGWFCYGCLDRLFEP